MNRREHLSQRPQRGLHRSLIPTMRPLDTKRKALVAVVDIGTSKTTCLVARLTPHPAPEALPRRSHAVKILGIGYCNSRGIKAGAVSNFEQVEQAVRQAFDSAEGHTSRCSPSCFRCPVGESRANHSPRHWMWPGWSPMKPLHGCLLQQARLQCGTVAPRCIVCRTVIRSTPPRAFTTRARC